MRDAASSPSPLAGEGWGGGVSRREQAVHHLLPILTISAVLLLLWYALAITLNWQLVTDAQSRAGITADFRTTATQALNHARPLLPAPHQIIEEVWRSTATLPVTSRRSLVHHAWITLSAALAGFGIGTLAGVLLAVAVTHIRALDRALMPWIVASQAVPVLALAPIVVVALGALGLDGLLPKALIAAFLCFFPVAIGMAKGLASADRLALDLLRTYSATRAQVFWTLRLPSSLPFLFAALKVAAAAAVVGAIVAELPTGAQAGLGARLLAGSYFGQTVQIWAALAVAAILSAALVGLLTLVERGLGRRMGARA